MHTLVIPCYYLEFQLSRTLQLSVSISMISRLISSSLAPWAAAGGSCRVLLCRSCARTLRKSLSTEVNINQVQSQIVHVCANCSSLIQASRGEVIELEEEMTVNELAKKLRTNPSTCV